MWWNQIWDIRLSSFTTTKQYFVLLGKLHCNFFLCLKSWPNAIKAPLINLFLKSWIYICYLPGGRSVWEKTVPEVLSTARGRRPRVVLKTKGTVFSHTDRPSPVNKIFIFSCSKLVLQPLTNGFVYATLYLNRVARRLLTICKNSLQRRNELSNSDTRQEKMY